MTYRPHRILVETFRFYYESTNVHTPVLTILQSVEEGDEG